MIDDFLISHDEYPKTQKIEVAERVAITSVADIDL